MHELEYGVRLVHEIEVNYTYEDRQYGATKLHKKSTKVKKTTLSENRLGV